MDLVNIVQSIQIPFVALLWLFLLGMWPALEWLIEQTRKPRPTLAPQAIIVGRINATTGIGMTTLGFLQNLVDRGAVRLLNTRPQDSDGADIPDRLLHGVHEPDPRSPGDVSIYTDVLWNGQSDRGYEKVPPSHVRMAYTMFDSDRVPEEWVRILNEHFDAAVVPDRNLVAAYLQSGVHVPVFVLPMAIFNLDDFLRQPLKKKRNFRFVFGCVASYSQRKNLETLIDAFADAFGNRPEEAMLRIHSDLNFEKYFERNILTRIGRHKISNIVATCSTIGRKEYIKLFRSFDAYVQVSKGEGFSLTPREALALGLPTILSLIPVHKTICETGLVRAVPANVREPAFYESIDGRVIGSQMGCRTEDVKNALFGVYNEYDHELAKAPERRAWAAQYAGTALRDKYLSLMFPAAVGLSDEDAIGDRKIHTTSLSLARKYRAALSDQRKRAGEKRASRLVVPLHDGGFYSIFNVFFSNLVWNLGYDGINAVLPDWRVKTLRREPTPRLTSWCYGTEADGNVWLKLFGPLDYPQISPEEYEDEQRLYADAQGPNSAWNYEFEPLLTYKHAYRLYRMPDFQKWRELYHSHYQRHIAPNGSITARVEEAHRAMLAHGHTLGVHVRHPSHAVEQPNLAMPTIERCFAQVDRYLGGLGHSERKSARIFLATDQELNIDMFRERYGEMMMTLTDVARTNRDEDTMFRALPHALQLEAGHQIQHITAADESKWSTKMAEDVIVDAMLLARCNAVFHVTSNIATAVGFMNPRVRMIPYDE
jgi:hypothetical protein